MLTCNYYCNQKQDCAPVTKPIKQILNDFTKVKRFDKVGLKLGLLLISLGKLNLKRAISSCVSPSSCVDGLGYVLRSPLIIKRNPEYKLLPVVQSTALA